MEYPLGSSWIKHPEGYFQEWKIEDFCWKESNDTSAITRPSSICWQKRRNWNSRGCTKGERTCICSDICHKSIVNRLKTYIKELNYKNKVCMKIYTNCKAPLRFPAEPLSSTFSVSAFETIVGNRLTHLFWKDEFIPCSYESIFFSCR